MLKIFLLLVCIWPSISFANNLPETLPDNGWSHGIAMHGAPALGKDIPHLPYANIDGAQGGRIVQSAVGTFDTLNPYTLKGTGIATPDFLFDRLTQRSWDEPFTLYGFIASDIWLSDDRKSIIFKLNPKARFNDDSPITARDIKATFELLRDQGRPNMRRTYKLVEDVKIYDDHHIGFSLGDAADQETPLILAMMPVLSAKEWDTRNFDQTTLEPLLSSSAYRVKDIDIGRSYTLEKNNNYWAKDHYLRRGLMNADIWEVQYFRDAGVALEAFKKGVVDFQIEQDPARWARQYDPRGFIKKEIKHNRPDRVRTLIFNLRRTPLDDKRVREALRLAFDQDWIIRTLGYDLLKPTYSVFPNTDLARDYTPDLEPKLDQELEPVSLRENLMKASALLDEAGYPVHKGQRDITLTLVLNDASLEKVALAWRAGLKKLGITLNIKTFDVVQFSGALSQFDYDIILHSWYNSLSPGSEQNVYWGCYASTQQGSLNYSGVCDDQIEQALSALVNAKNRDDLKHAAQYLDQLLWDNVIGIYLPHRQSDLIAFWPENINLGPQNALYGFVLESLAITP